MGRMDYAAAIECHRQPLLRIIAGLYAMIGLAEGGSIDRFSRPVYRKVLSLLKPAEWAVRRLIVIAAQGLVVEPPANCKSAKRPAAANKTKRKRQRRRAFALLDPLPREIGFPTRRRITHPTVMPRIRVLGDNPYLVPPFLRPAPPPPPEPAPKQPAPDGGVSGKSLCRRLDAIKRALEDLPGQAKRYARLRAKAIAEHAPKRDTALRRLPPPKAHRKPRHEVHDILEECDWLVRTLPKPDSS
jgi:hypothetical protein